MKHFATKSALLACLLAPAFANAALITHSPSSTSFSDVVSFTVSNGFTGAVAVGYNWADFGVSKTTGGKTFSLYEDATSLGWTLTNGVTTQTGTLVDTPNSHTGGTLMTHGNYQNSYQDTTWSGLSGTGSLNFNTLAAGAYTLTLTGEWGGLVAGNGFSSFKVQPIVNLAAAGVGGAVTVTQTAIPAVPEPESYAMLLAGLGIMAVVARRRKNRI